MEIGFEYLGKFHPVVLHLPIGAMMFTLVMVILAIKNLSTFSKPIKIGLIFSFFSALTASILGYLLYRSGGYDEAAIENHLILGWCSTASMGLLWYLFERVAFQSIFIPSFFATIVLLMFTGHYGGQITHGEDYLSLPTAEQQQVGINLDSISLYSLAVAKIMDKKCVNCHNYSKRKGGLALHLPQSILEGGERGLPFEAGNSKESRMVNFAHLPLDDDLHMPPKGRPQLTTSEINLLAYWIDQGAQFDQSVALSQFPEEIQQTMTQFFPQSLPDVDPLSVSVLKKLQTAGFRVSSFTFDTPFIQVKFLKDTLTESALSSMIDAADQIVELELSDLNLPERFWKEIKKLKNLQKLRLDGTNIQDKHLPQFTSLPLRSLNLAGTAISTSGLESILKISTLEYVYIWDSEISTQEETKLQEQTAVKLVSGIFVGFAAPQQLKLPQLITEKTLFDTQLNVDFFNKISGNIIRYTLDGSIPDSTSLEYKDPIQIDRSLTLKARSFKNGWLPSEVLTEEYFKVRKRVENYKMITRPSDRYTGVHKLFDFEEGTVNFADGKWLGFSGNDLVFTTNISGEDSIKNITVSCMESIGGWIIYPKRLQVYGRKGDGAFNKIGQYDYRPDKIPTEATKKSFTIAVDTEDYTELKVVVENVQKLPSWHPSAGEDAWLFVDEILFW